MSEVAETKGQSHFRLSISTEYLHDMKERMGMSHWKDKGFILHLIETNYEHPVDCERSELEIVEVALAK